MDETTRCPECGATWLAGKPCQDYFYQMLYWENEFPAYGAVHHLMVLCYHLQHPSLYSPAGLEGAMRLLADFIEGDLTTAMALQRERARQHPVKIKAATGAAGAYRHPVQWQLTAVGVVANGASAYPDSVGAWARSVLADLRASGNLP